MQSHIMIKAGGAPLSLPSDFSLDVELKNPMFNDVETFSYPVQIPLTGNRHLLKNMDSRHSAMRPVSVEHEASEIYAEGFQLFKGEIATSVDEELSDSLSFNIEGNKTLKSLIQDLDCKDIRVKDDICIGEKITRIKAYCTGNMGSKVLATGRLYNSQGVSIMGDRDITLLFSLNVGQQTGISEFTPQALGFSVPYKCIDGSPSYPATARSETATDVDGYVRVNPQYDESFINVSSPYPTAKYCNARVAYKNYALDSSGETADSVVEGNPYKVLDADRPQSGICFYVLYFLDCLFAHFGLDWDNSELLKIEDMKRLCFYTTKCSYDTEDVQHRNDTNGFDAVNEWLRSRGCGTEMSVQTDDSAEAQMVSAGVGSAISLDNAFVLLNGQLNKQLILTVDSEGTKNQEISIVTNGFRHVSPSGQAWRDAEAGVYTFKCSKVSSISNEWNDFSLQNVVSYYGYMYANSGNFPDTTVTTIIESLENQFGIRFIYDAEGKKVTARLLRDMYRSQSAPHRLLGKTDSMVKVAEKITGVRCCYGDESERKSQSDNLRDKVRDYDTSYDYIDYPDPSAEKGMAGASAARTTDIDHQFADIVGNPTNTDNTCYIDQQTGNAYRVKIDSEASSANSQKPRWFEVGQNKGVEFGDCSTENEDFVTVISSDLQPVPLSDVAYPSSMGTRQPNLVAFCDEDMEHEYVKQYLSYPFDVTYGSVYVRAELRTEEAYDTEKSDDGNSPLQTYDWGNAIAIMRGGGTDASTQLYDSGYDGFANSKWRQVAGRYALTTDSIDPYGNQYDYNGTADGVLAGERFSLKPRAYKGWLCPWATSALCNADQLNDGDASNDNQPWYYYIRNRGWVDRFLFEHAHFLLERRKFKVLVHCSAAVLMDIKNHWADRWLIDGEVGYIDKVSASLSAATGIDQVEITFYAI